MSLDDKVTTACHRIEEMWYETEDKCYVSFSGGKDSTVLLALIKLCEEVLTIPVGGIPAVFSNTGIEMGVTVDFVRWCRDSGWYSNVQIIRPEHSFDWCIKNYGKPIRSKIRSEFLNRWHTGRRTRSVYQNLVTGVSNSGKHAGRTKLADRDMHMLHDDFSIIPTKMCCDTLKKKPFKKYAKENGMKGYLYGIRQAEGGAREINSIWRSSKGKRLCTSISGNVIKKAPIIDWNDEDIEGFIDQYNVPLSDAYTKYGFHRTGCMACPYAQDVDKSLEYLYFHEPNRYKAIMHWLKDVYIAQNVVLPFDEAYEREREREWRTRYEPMRQEMLRKYRPNSKLITDYQQLSIFDEVGND